MPTPDRLLFIDTNIWLDFYREQTGVELTLLRHLEDIKDRLIMTRHVQFKGNRQRVISETYEAPKPPSDIQKAVFFLDAKPAKALAARNNVKETPAPCVEPPLHTAVR